MVFFDSRQCVQCSTLLGFDPESLSVLALTAQDSGVFVADNGQTHRLCENATQYDVCNWLLPKHDESKYCLSCRLTTTIPNLENEINLARWRSLEEAKRRLAYTLLSLGLSLDGELKFEFLEDGRSDPDRYGDSHIPSGYLNGVITINVLEADTVARESERAALNEPQRTLLGHMRHESGHHYYHKLSQLPVQEAAEWVADFNAEFLNLFGDPNIDYAAALAAHYANGPPAEWQMNYISAYAACHPLEDWAETWTHYLNMVDSLETGANYNLSPKEILRLPFDERLGRFRELSTAVNELNRSGGSEDVYPYVISPVAATKLRFVERAIWRLQTQN